MKKNLTLCALTLGASLAVPTHAMQAQPEHLPQLGDIGSGFDLTSARELFAQYSQGYRRGDLWDDLPSIPTPLDNWREFEHSHLGEWMGREEFLQKKIEFRQARLAARLEFLIEKKQKFLERKCSMHHHCWPKDPPPAVPVPAAMWLFGSALLALAGIKRRK